MLAVAFWVNASWKDTLINSIIEENGTDVWRFSCSRELMKLAWIIDNTNEAVTRNEYRQLEELEDTLRNELMDNLYEESLKYMLKRHQRVIVPMHLVVLKEVNGSLIYDIPLFNFWYEYVQKFVRIDADAESILRRISDDMKTWKRERIVPDVNAINKQREIGNAKRKDLQLQYMDKSYFLIDNSDWNSIWENTYLLNNYLMQW